MSRLRAALVVLLATACIADPAPNDGEDGPASDGLQGDGPFGVGRIEAQVVSGPDRTVPVSLWYPTDDEARADDPVAGAFYDDPADQAAYQALLDAAPADCPRRTSASVIEGVPAAGEHPWVVFSHCDACTRFSGLSMAERLATHGFVVVAPDHVGNTLLVEQEGDGLPLNTDTLALRLGDVVASVDALLQGDLAPAGLTVDPDRGGAMGHSFGAVTAGLFTQDDGRARALLALAAPVDNPLLPGVDAEGLMVPTAFVVAMEDHSILEVGNTLIRNNHEAVAGPSWRVEVADAGHWSCSDLVGVVEDFLPGCGDDTRMGASDEAFTYPDPAEIRALHGEIAVRFFTHHLADGGDTLDRVAATVTRREGTP